MAPRNREPLIARRYGDAFEATDLEGVPSQRGVGRLIAAGAQTDACIRSTLHGAFARGYDVALAAAAHTTDDFTAYGAPPPAQVVAHTHLYWKFQEAPGRTAAVIATEDVNFDEA